jgi:hypothetical protein
LGLVYRPLIGGGKQNLPVKPFRSWPPLIASGLSCFISGLAFALLGRSPR